MKKTSVDLEIIRKNLEYWIKKIPANIQPTGLKLDLQRPVDYTGKIGTLPLEMDRDLSQKITGLAGSEPFLVYTVLVSALTICLYKYNKAPGIVVGSPALEGQEKTAQNNAVPVISEIGDNCSFKDLLFYIKDNLVESYKKQDYPYEQLIQKLSLQQVANKCPLFNIAIALKNIHRPLPSLKTDICIDFSQEPPGLVGTISYNENLYYRGTIEQFSTHYIQVLKAVMQQPGILISGISLISEPERQELLFSWNNTATDYPADKCIHQLFEAAVEKSPQVAALVCGSQKLSYRDLDDQANRLAHYLQELGVKPNALVGLFVERSPEMIIGMLGVLKAGGAYIPMDPSYPQERIGAMLGAGKFELIVTKVSLYNNLPKTDTKIICLDYDTEKIAQQSNQRCDTPVTVKDLAYVVFTSGSTGVPKGAGVYHKGWTNLIYFFTKRFGIDSPDKNLIISSFSFDLTQRAIALSLISEGELHLLSTNYYDPDLIAKIIEGEKITVLNCVPSTFYPLIENKAEEALKKLLSLRLLFLGGEAISASRLKNWAESPLCNAEIFNMYGIAECTDVSTFYRLDNYDRYLKSSVPAGKPIFNTQVFILDEELKLVPKGFVGEICIAGDGIGKGYINDEIATAEKFIPNPFKTDWPSSETLYRTGDLGRFLPGGDIEFIGRVDQQIKIRGCRIDLGDIETAIRQNDLIKDSVVAVKSLSQDDQRLIAYLVRKPGESSLTDEEIGDRVREFLNDKLPNYMVPNLFCVLPELPLNPNGKVDRNALPDPEGLKTNPADENENTEIRVIEKKLLGIFAEVLKIQKVGIDDNFFQIGGHSLLAAQVITAASQNLKVELAQIDLLANPTAKRFAGRIMEIKAA